LALRQKSPFGVIRKGFFLDYYSGVSFDFGKPTLKNLALFEMKFGACYDFFGSLSFVSK